MTTMEFFDSNTYIGRPRNAPTGQPAVPGATVDELIAAMDCSGVARALVWHVAQRDVDPPTGNAMLAEAIAGRERLVGCWTILPDCCGELGGVDAFLRAAAAAGVRAFRAFPELNRYLPRRPVIGELMDAFVAARAPLILSIGQGVAWSTVYDLLEEWPELTVVLADVGCWGTDRYFRPLLKTYPNVYLELSGYILDGVIEALVRDLGPDRLLYGSAWPEGYHGGMMLAIRHAEIAEAAKAAIASGNLQRLLDEVRIGPRPGDSAGREGTRHSAFGIRNTDPGRAKTTRAECRMTNAGLGHAFWSSGRSADCPVIDVHGHMGPWPAIWFPRGDTDSMIHTMDQCGVRLLVFCHHGALMSPDIGNAANVAAVRQYPGRLRAYLGINPHYPDVTAADLAAFDGLRDVFVGLKLLSDYHLVPWDDRAYEPAWRFADDRGLIVLGHTWRGSPFDGPEQIRRAAERYPNIRLLLGHSINNDWPAAAEIAAAFPNVYLELTSVMRNRGAVEGFVAAGLSGKLLFGTDLPWFDPHHEIGCLLSADISDDDRHNILHRNAERLLVEVGVVLA